MPIVFLTADRSVAVAQDRELMLQSKQWAEQMVRQGAGRFAHHHVRFGRRDQSPAIREAMVQGFVRAAQMAGDQPVMLMVAHGTEVSIDLAPAPHWSVSTQDFARAMSFINQNMANARAGRPVRPARYSNASEALSLLRDALCTGANPINRIEQLDLFCCECGRGRDLVRRLGLTLRLPHLRAVNGYVITLDLRRGDQTQDQAQRRGPRRSRAIGLGNFSGQSLGNSGTRRLRECTLPTEHWVEVPVALPVFPPPPER